MATSRTASAIWTGDLLSGSGVVSSGSSQTFNDLPVSWKTRTESAESNTSPEELVAAAHASCFSMALSAGLSKNGTPPDQLEVEATVTFSQVEGGWKVTSSSLNVVGSVPGLELEAFQDAAEAAKEGCPISGAIKGNVELSVKASLSN